jgi:ribulose-phosphate 3-epimerase
MAKIGVQRICFHPEAALHIDRLLGLIRDAGIRAGIALMPATPLSVLEYCLDRLDFLLLMLINPGFAGHACETQVPYALHKVADCRRFLEEREFDIPIEVDGRVSFENIPGLVAAGATELVAGSRSAFHPGSDLAGNVARMREAIARGIAMGQDA